MCKTGIALNIHGLGKNSICVEIACNRTIRLGGYQPFYHATRYAYVKYSHTPLNFFIKCAELIIMDYI